MTHATRFLDFDFDLFREEDTRCFQLSIQKEGGNVAAPNAQLGSFYTLSEQSFCYPLIFLGTPGARPKE